MGEFTLYFVIFFAILSRKLHLLAQKLCSTKSKRRKAINLHISVFLGINSLTVIGNLQEISGACLAVWRLVQSVKL